MLPARRIFAGVAFLALSGFVSGTALAQSPAAAAAPATAAPNGSALSAGQLDALMAPIALYPDALLAKICIAATFPIDVVQAERWLQANPNLKGSALETAVASQPWDDSVKGLVEVPSVLQMMSQQIDWTRNVGNAFVAQQQDVMASVQRLRVQAQNNGNLKSTEQQTVQTYDNQIVIEPVQAEQVYVPYYASSVYGDWAYPSYPAYYWPPPAGYGVAAGIGFLAGAAIASNWWGYGFNWGNGGGAYINHHTNFNNFNNYNANRNNGQRWNGNRNGLGNRNGVGNGNGLGNRNGIGNRNGLVGSNRPAHHRGNSKLGSNNRGNLHNRGSYGGNGLSNRGLGGNTGASRNNAFGNRGSHGGSAIGNRGGSGGNRSFGSRSGTYGGAGGGGHQLGNRGGSRAMGGSRGGGRAGGGGRGGGRGGGGRRR